MVQEGDEAIVTQVPGLEGFGVDAPEIRAQRGPVYRCGKGRRHGFLQSIKDRFPLHASGDAALPLGQDFFCFGHGKTHELKAHLWQVLRFVENERQLLPFGTLVESFSHKPEGGDEISVHHVPIRIDAPGFQPGEKLVTPPHDAAARGDLALGHRRGIEIILLRRKA